MSWGDLKWWWTWRRFKRARRRREYELFAAYQTTEWLRVKEENRWLGVW